MTILGIPMGQRLDKAEFSGKWGTSHATSKRGRNEHRRESLTMPRKPWEESHVFSNNLLGEGEGMGKIDRVKEKEMIEKKVCGGATAYSDRRRSRGFANAQVRIFESGELASSSKLRKNGGRSRRVVGSSHVG